jgi:hypothetical protein
MNRRSLLAVLVALVAFASFAEARVYSAALGRWLSRDPAGYFDGPNHYQYTARKER